MRKVGPLSKAMFGALFSACIVLVLQTGMRGATGIGLGEMGLAVLVMFVLFAKFPTLVASLGGREFRILLWYGLWVLLILTPTTLLMSALDMPGSSMRDLTAYIFVSLVIAAIALMRDTLPLIGRSFVIFLLTTLVWQYFFGGSDVWYHGVRFTAGAENPNQLALYLVCAELFVVLFTRNMLLKLLFLCIFFVFGIISGSDAYLLSRIVMLIMALIMFVISKRRFWYLFPFLVMSIVGVLIPTYTDISSILEAYLMTADEGGSRLTILANGVRAWLDTPFSALFGNGAGAFSGYAGPFQSFEAHNTLVDMLSIGGPAGAALVYTPLLALAFRSYSNDLWLISAFVGGLMAFSMFHFMGRQPVTWIVLYTCSYTVLLLKRKLN